MAMQTIGLIGGMSWHSTASYYRIINETVADRLGGHASASIALQSLDFSEVRAVPGRRRLGGAGDLLSRAAGAASPAAPTWSRSAPT